MYLYEIVLPSKRKVLRLTEETQPSCSTDCWSLSRSQQLFFCLFVSLLCAAVFIQDVYIIKKKKKKLTPDKN